MKNPTPLRAIRKACLACAQSPKEVANCQEKNCPLWSYRFGRRPKEKAKVGAQKAIRRYCLECAESPSEVRLCPSKDCALYIYRLGRNPRRAGVGGNPKIWLKSKNAVVELEKNKASRLAIEEP